VVLAYAAYWLNEVFRSNLRGPDFFSYYAIAKLEVQRGPARVYDLALQKQFQDQVTAQWPGHFILLPHLLPPYFTLLLAPLGVLPFRTAYAVWGLLTIALVAGGALALLAAARLERRGAWLLGLLAAAYLPVFVLVVQGQSDGFAILGLGLCALAWTRGRPGLAGLAAGLALVKPQLVLLLPVLFLARSPRALAGFAAAGIAFVLASLPFFGIAGWRAYLGLVGPWLLGGHAGFPIVGQSLFSLRGALQHLPGGTPVALAVLAAVLLGVAACLFLRPPRPRLDFALAVAASVALSSYINVHDLSLLLVPMLLLASLLLDGEMRWPRLGWAALAFSYLGVELYLQLGVVPAALGVLALAAYLLAERLGAGLEQHHLRLRFA
jgi:hypothetical protein